jgi:hypothetical protein
MLGAANDRPPMGCARKSPPFHDAHHHHTLAHAYANTHARTHARKYARTHARTHACTHAPWLTLPRATIAGFLEITEGATDDSQVTGKAYWHMAYAIAGPLAVAAVIHDTAQAANQGAPQSAEPFPLPPSFPLSMGLRASNINA